MVISLKKEYFKERLFFTMQEEGNIQDLAADTLLEGEYKFLPYRVRDKAAEELVEMTARGDRGSSSESN